jgi:hypothetical protein
MSRDEHPSTRITGRFFADADWKYENTLWPPAVQREIKAELDAKKAAATQHVLEMVQREKTTFPEELDAVTAGLDKLADEYEDAARRAREGRITADQLDKELLRLDAQRRALESRAEEPDRIAARIARIEADPLGHLDALFARYPALPKPDLSFMPSHGL